MSTASSIVDRPSSLALIAADIKIAHSVFALPFAILAAFMAAEQAFPIPPDAAEADWPGLWLLGRLLGPLTLIVLAMVLARTVAMLANRWIDREIDRRNPRTANRALASGKLTPTAAVIAMIACATGFMLVCAAFGIFYRNLWPLILGLPVLAWISAYGYLKRFTALCHVYLGTSLAISPLAAAIAVDPATLAHQPSIWLLSGMVLCWVAGFDIIYALQDVEIDRAQRLHSMPARLGVPAAMWISRALHLLAVACLLAAWRVDQRLELAFLAGIAIVAALLLLEHLTVHRWGTTRMALAFFTINGVIACILGVIGVIDIALLE